MSEHESDTVEIIVFYQKDVLLKPYVALITGLDSKYRYAREFLKPTVEYFPYGKLFRYTLPCDGIYERSIRTLDKATGKVVTSKKDWFISCDGVERAIRYSDIPDALDDFSGMWERVS